MSKSNPSRPSTLPTQFVDWNRVRQQHAEDSNNSAATKRHEADLEKLDNTDASRGGCRK